MRAHCIAFFLALFAVGACKVRVKAKASLDTDVGTEEPDLEADEMVAGSAEVIEDKVVLYRRIHFATNSAEILGDSYTLLDDLASLLAAQRRVRRVHVFGHTDERGSQTDNVALSQARAEAVAAALKARGLDTDVAAWGFGERAPRCVDYRKPNCHELNRRVELALELEDAPR